MIQELHKLRQQQVNNEGTPAAGGDTPSFGLNSAITTMLLTALPSDINVVLPVVVDDDFIIIVVQTRDNTGFTPPSGWTSLAVLEGVPGATLAYEVFYKIGVASTDSEATITISIADPGNSSSALAFTFKDVNTTSPYEGLVEVNNTNASDGYPFLAVNTLTLGNTFGDNRLGVILYVVNDNVAFENNSTSFTEIINITTSAADDSAYYVDAQEVTTSGSTASGVSTKTNLGGAADAVAIIGFYLKPI